MALTPLQKILALDKVFPSDGVILRDGKAYIWIPEPIKGQALVNVCDAPDRYNMTYSHSITLSAAYKMFCK